MKKILCFCMSVWIAISVFSPYLNAQQIAFTFTADYNCSYSQLDSVFIQNVTQGSDTTLYYPDTVLSFGYTQIENITMSGNDFFVSQNYPNPFEHTTEIDIYVPERDVFTLNVYNVTGKKLAGIERLLTEGLHTFTFYAGNDKSYILTVNSQKYIEQILMIRFGSSGSLTPKIVHSGSKSLSEPLLEMRSTRSEFLYNIGDVLSFTGFVTDAENNAAYHTITDNPIQNQTYVFNIAPNPPSAPEYISGDVEMCANTQGIIYEVPPAEDVWYLWNVPQGWNITDGQNTNIITVTAGASDGVISVVAINNCGESDATELFVSVKTESTPPASVSGNTAICPGANTSLTVQGGSLGTGANWKWYTGSCGANLVGSGQTINVSPAEATTYYVRAEGECNITDCYEVTVTIKTLSVTATSIEGNLLICAGEETELSVVGGSLGTGASWNWFTETCGGNFIGTGESITVSPQVTTTYFVRAIGDCNTTSCRVTTVNVKSESVQPTGISGETEICPGENTDISVTGGSLGAGASWKWYSETCGGTLIGTGEMINLQPGQTTNYFVRAEGECNTTECYEFTITVKTESMQPTSILGESEICPGEETVLSVEGGFLGSDAEWYWYSESCGGSFISSGEQISVSPNETTTYYVRAQGACNTTECQEITVIFKSYSTEAEGIIGESEICPGENSVLGIVGGSLGSGAEWYWYSQNCGGTLVGTGESIVVSPEESEIYFVRAQGDCNITDCQQIAITVKTESIPVSHIEGDSEICNGENTSLSIVGGVLGTGAQWYWYENMCGNNPVGTGENINISPDETTTYFVRAEGDCNITDCQQMTVVIKTESIMASGILGELEICPGSNSDLSVVDGFLGTGAEWYWYSESCGGNLIGSGNTINVQPSENTTYFVRAEGDCNITECQQVTIIIKTESIMPQNVSGEAIICPGDEVNISVIGGSLGSGAVWQWYAESCGGIMQEIGETITVAPQETTTYFVRAEGDCNITDCLDLTISVKTESLPAAEISGETDLCPGDNTELSVVGGLLGTGANWEWYSGTCGQTHIGTGIAISVEPSESTEYFVRAEGDCNISACTQVIVTIKTESSDPVSIEGEPEICPGENTELTVQGGLLGTGAEWHWFTEGCGSVPAGIGESITVSPQENKTYFVRAEGDCNITNCTDAVVTVKVESVAPNSIQGDTEICLGDDLVLTVIGGSTGTDAVWIWYSETCGGNLVDTGESITVSPLDNATYYVRAEGDCNITDCAELEISVNTVPDAATEEIHVAGIFEIDWHWSIVIEADGYKYNTENDFNTATDLGLQNSFFQENIDCGTEHTLFVWAYNECGPSLVLVLTENTEECPWLCGDEIEYEAYSYSTVEIGNQCWFAENLRYLPSVVGNATTSSSVPYYYVYDFQGTDVQAAMATQEYADYGVLYNWPAANNACPPGWKLPSDSDWKVMEIELGMTQEEADAIYWRGTDQGAKLAGNAALWQPDNITADPNFGLSGFDAVPGGNSQSFGFNQIEYGAYFWTSTPVGAFRYHRFLYNMMLSVFREQANPAFGYSVRCIKE